MELVWNKRVNKFCEVEKSDGRKTFLLLQKLQRDSEVKEKQLKSKGVCPYCHCYRPMSGICDCER